MEPMRRRARIWRILAGSALAVSLIVGGRALWGRWEADRRWVAMGREIELLKEEAARREGLRPALHKSPEPGNAWEDYKRALDELKRIGVDHGLFWEILYENGRMGKSQIDSWVYRSHPAVDHLRKGARRGEARFPFQWDPLSEQRGKNDITDFEVGLAALSAARHLRASETPVEALDLILDAAIFGRDLAHTGWLRDESQGLHLVRLSCVEIGSMIHSRSLGASEGPQIDQALEWIERGLPDEGISIMNGVAVLAGGRIRGMPWGDMFGAVKFDFEGPLTPGWRHGFSTRLMEVEAFERLLAVARRHAGSGDQPWEGARVMEAESRAFLLENGWASILRMPPVLDRRQTLAQIRMLRLAVRWLSKGDVLSIVDPFGPLIRVEKRLPGGGRSLASAPSPLRTSERGNTPKIWSVGPDGVDHEGTERDLLLEVAR